MAGSRDKFTDTLITGPEICIFQNLAKAYDTADHDQLFKTVVLFYKAMW